jgi:gluconate 2-dehydrogenase
METTMSMLRDPRAATRRRVLVTRAIDPAVIEVLRPHVELSLNLDDADWSQLELIERLQGHWGALVTVGERIDAALLDACPALRAVCSLGVGVNNIDIAACTARGVVVTNAPDVLTETTADLGFALMMAAARRVGESERFLRQGAWTRWSCDFFTGMEVHGATLGILGMGRIGQAVARRGALGFGMPVIYHNRNPLPAEVAEPLGARWVSFDALMQEADHLVIVLPYSANVHHIVDARALGLMKPSATLTNVGRAAWSMSWHWRRLWGQGAWPQRRWMCSSTNLLCHRPCLIGPTRCSRPTSVAPRARPDAPWRAWPPITLSPWLADRTP